MSSRYGTESDHYKYQGTNVLKNKFGFRDEPLLESAERDFTTTRIFQLKEEPLTGALDFSYLKKIHKFVFRDVYSWAGKVRDIEMSKDTTQFCRVIYIDSEAARIFEQLEYCNCLEDLPEKAFVHKLAELFGDLNMLHPFREGNGRIQRLFLEELARRSGYDLDFSRVSAQEMLESSIHSAHGDFSSTEKMLEKSLGLLSSEVNY